MLLPRCLRYLSRRLLFTSGVAALSLVFLFQFSFHFFHQSLNLTQPSFYFFIILFAFLFWPLLILIWRGLNRFAAFHTAHLKTKPYANRHGQWLLIWLALILCWWPVFLSVYPGFFCYGSSQQLSSFLAGTFNNGQPLLHTLLLGQTIETASHLTNSYNSAIAIFVSLQIILLTGIFTYTLYFINKMALHSCFKILLLLYYAFCPVLIIYGLSTTPDAFFAAFVLLFIIMLIDYFQKPLVFLHKKIKLALFILVILLMLAFRFNPQQPFPFSLSPGLDTAHFCSKVEVPAHFAGQIPFLQQVYWHFGSQSFLAVTTTGVLALLLVALSYSFYRRHYFATLPLIFLLCLVFITFIFSPIFTLRSFAFLFFCLPIILIGLFYSDEL